MQRQLNATLSKASPRCPVCGGELIKLCPLGHQNDSGSVPARPREGQSPRGGVTGSVPKNATRKMVSKRFGGQDAEPRSLAGVRVGGQ